MKPVFGIDLGTSNSALALARDVEGTIDTLNLTQAVEAHAVGEAPTLPSALYLPAEGEWSDGGPRMPWTPEGERSPLIGQFARDHGALVPDRLVTSAKSWLCNPHIDRRAAILPWKAAESVAQFSPVDASRQYLQHLRGAAHTASQLDPNEADVILTVPASFDEVARSLTHAAADEAGLRNVTLLEEPQAAFYAWLDATGSEWREHVTPGDVVLVCDVGGGTADFSLIAIRETEGNLELERIAVGEHILLGGDNIDLALGYATRAMLEAEGTELDDWQFRSLVLSCRAAKERLFSDETLDSIPLAIPSRGSSLFAGSISANLPRELLHQIALEGFLPQTDITDLPAERSGLGLQEFGLAYATEAALSKHLARFLTRALANVTSGGVNVPYNPDLGYLRPTAVLFNGGAFKAEIMRQRLLDVVNQWPGDSEVRELAGARYDLAVAHGAAAYGRMRASGEGIRIKAGTARSYYLGVETTMLAVPGFTPPVKGVCVVPQGMEEGTEAVLSDKEFGLVVGQAAHFRFFSSEVRAGDEAGSLVGNAERDLEETSSLEIELPAVDGFNAGEAVPVQLHSRVTELGTLELWMQHTRSDQRWKLEFQVRTE